MQLLAIYYVLLHVQPTHPGVAWLPVDAVRTGKASTSIQLSPEAVAEPGRGVQKRRANQGFQQQSQSGGGGNQGDCRGTRDYSHRAAAKVAIKATGVTVRKTRAVSMAKRALGLSLPAQWAINSKLGHPTGNQVKRKCIERKPPAVAAKESTDCCRTC